jgi:broad specificity phosphatase PhoE
LGKLILIKHSLPEMIPSVPASQWPLSKIGRLRCINLAEKLSCYSPDFIISSTESKAIETAQIVADHLHHTFQIVEGLQEHDRSNVAWRSRKQFEAQIMEFFRYPQSLMMGKETAAQAYARFTQAVTGLIDKHPGHNIAIVAHGTVITLLMAKAFDLDPFSFWKRLGLPSFVVLSLPKMELVTIVESVEEVNEINL